MRATMLCCAFCLLLGAKSFADTPAPNFLGQIAPLLTRACLGCHHGTEAAGQFDLSSVAGARAAGESGATAIVPGNVDGSYLIERIRDREMPPPGKGTPLSTEEKSLLTLKFQTFEEAQLVAV